MTLEEMEERIRYIARRSKYFKIGKTSQDAEDRLIQHPPRYKAVEEITFSKYKQRIDEYEEKMIERFIHLPNCDNKNAGSAGRMPTKPFYVLYVVYTLK